MKDHEFAVLVLELERGAADCYALMRASQHFRHPSLRGPMRCIYVLMGMRASLAELRENKPLDLADSLKVVTVVYNSLFHFSLPYMLAFHRGEGRVLHLRLEFYQVHRSRLKYAAGIEWRAWTLTYDALPEDARELKEALKRAVKA